MTPLVERLQIGSGFDRVKTPEVRRGILIDSENFYQYLLPESPLVTKDAIAPVLVLPGFAPYLRDLNTPSREAVPQQVREDTQPMHLRGFTVDPALQKYFSPMDQEETLSFFYDQDGYLRPSKRIIGTDEEVYNDLIDLLYAGNTPAATSHQHELPLLPSFDDPLQHAVQAYKDHPNVPLVKASFVVLPDVQILQVSTTDTMKPMTKEERDAYTISWKRHFEEVKTRETKASWDAWAASPHDTDAMKQYFNALFQTDHQLRVECMRTTGLAYFMATDYMTYNKFTV